MSGAADAPTRALVTTLALALWLVLLPAGPARADLSQQASCASDALDAREALQRLDWARRCGLLHNSSGANSWFPSTRAFDAAGFPAVIVGAKEYREVNPSRAFSGNAHSYDVNFASAFYRYQGPLLFSVSLETSGLISGYYKWTGTSPRAFPYYPTFGSIVTGGVELFPLPTVYGDCNLYQWDAVAGTVTSWTGDHFVVAYCPSDASALAQKDEQVEYDNRILLFRAIPEEVLPR